MRAAVVFFGAQRRDSVLSIARGVVAGIERQGVSVDLIDGDRDIGTKLTPYQYLVVGTRTDSLFGGKIPEQVTSFLSQAGMITGKKSFAFVVRSPLGSGKALMRVMSAMEHEGLFIRYSEVLRSVPEAQVVGERLNLQS